MGVIDVDPASNDVAQRTVNASRYYTKERSGLDVRWDGKVWMNPPYSASLIKQFAEKLKVECLFGGVTGFCVLTNNATETKWFSDILNVADAVCFLNKRVRFLDPEGNEGASPLQGQVVFYRGSEISKFTSEFSKYGHIVFTKVGAG
jgi:hypothetical protein